jgi:hypothetical protein
LSERGRVGQQHICRRKRVDGDCREQTRPRFVELTQAGLVHERLDRASPSEISLEDAAMQLAALPRGVGEPFVPSLRAAIRMTSDDLAKLA